MQQLDIGGVISRVFNTYRENLGILLPAALIVFLPFAIINGLIIASGANLLLVLLTTLLQVVASFLLTGMIVQLVRDVQDGRRDSTLGELFQSAVPVLGALIAVAILAGLGIAFGFVLLIVPGLILLTLWAVVVPVTVVERPGVMAAFGRSRELVRGNGWQVFAVLVLFVVIQFVLTRILTAVITGISASLASVIIAQLLANVIVVPLVALAAPTLYFQLRALKEGAGAGAAGSPATAGAGTVGPAPTGVPGAAPGTPPTPTGVPGSPPTSQPPPGAAAPGAPPPGAAPAGAPPPGAPPPGSPPPGA